MKVILYKLNKKENSTKQPESGLVIECIIKAPCTILNPAIIFSDTSYIEYNYCYIEKWNRYYFIRNWEIDGKRCIASLNVDVLSTYKDCILSSTNFVVRSASQKDDNIIDLKYIKKTDVTTVTAQPNLTNYNWSGNLQNGSYVVGIINGDIDAVGSVSYYVMTQTEFRTLCNFMFENTTSWIGIPTDEISEGLQKALFNPFQYISSINWFPFAVATGQAVSTIKFGWWQFSVSASNISETGYSAFRLVYSVPKHPKTLSVGKYLNCSHFSYYSAFIPGFGVFELPTNLLYNIDSLWADIVVDSITGKAIVQIRGENSNDIIILKEAQIGVPIQISSITSGDVGIKGGSAILGSAVTSIADFFGYGNAAAIGSAITMQNATLSNLGSNGYTTQFFYPPYIQAIFYDIGDTYNGKFGSPLCKPKLLGGLSGYVVCSNSTIDGGFYGTYEEYEKVIDYMESGFYIE